MSWFGDNTFEQDLLDEIENVMYRHSASYVEAVGAVAQVLGYLSKSLIFKDAVLKKLKQEALEEAKRELLEKINQ